MTLHLFGSEVTFETPWAFALLAIVLVAAAVELRRERVRPAGMLFVPVLTSFQQSFVAPANVPRGAFSNFSLQTFATKIHAWRTHAPLEIFSAGANRAKC